MVAASALAQSERDHRGEDEEGAHAHHHEAERIYHGIAEAHVHLGALLRLLVEDVDERMYDARRVQYALKSHSINLVRDIWRYSELSSTFHHLVLSTI